MTKHTFIFPIAVLKEKVEKHTSYLGVMRGDKETPNYADRLSLTEGESFLSDEYLEEAAAETYHWIKAFGKNIQEAYKVHPDCQLVRIDENNGAKITVGGKEITLPSSVIPLTRDMYTAVQNPAGTVTGNVIVYDVNIHLPELRFQVGRATELRVDVITHYTTIADGVFEDSCTQTAHWSFTEDEIRDTYTFGIGVLQNDFPTELKSIDSIEIVVVDGITPKHELSVGDYIELTTMSGQKQYGIVKTVVDDTYIAEWLPMDMRNSIAFKIDLPEWADENMLPIAKRHLEDALVNYIIYRWFETVNPNEAGGYYAKWEDKAHKAQVALNTEKRILQRSSDWLH